MNIATRWNDYLAFSAFAILFFGIKLWVIAIYGNATPYWDQWDAEAANLYIPFFEGTLGWAELLAPHNEHRIFNTRLLSLALLTTNGIWNPLLQMVVNAVLHIGTLAFGIALLTRVTGQHYLHVLLIFSLVLFGIPFGWENTLAGFQSQFYFVMFFSIACLWLTVTSHPLSVSWWLGVACAIFAFLSLASGVFALAAAAVVGSVLYGAGLRRSHRQLLAVAVLIGLFVAGVALTPTLAHHESLRAASFLQFYHALMNVLGWPISSDYLAALFRNLPALLFIGILLWTRPPAEDRRWFLMALVVWTFGQAVSIAYGRAVGSLSPRYLDLFSICILVNFTCLISMFQELAGRKFGWKMAGVSIWTIAVIVSVPLNTGERIAKELNYKRETGLAQERNTRNYLTTGDMAHLRHKQRLHVPYPDPDRLATILASPDIRAILPDNISATPLSSSAIQSEPTGAFMKERFLPVGPLRGGNTLSSFGARGRATTGKASIQFKENKYSAILAIPVAGYPLDSGITLEIEQNGNHHPVTIAGNPGEFWGLATAELEAGPFSILLADTSNRAWVAVGAPYRIGRFDTLINNLLTNYSVFIVLGLVLGVILLTHRAGLRH